MAISTFTSPNRNTGREKTSSTGKDVLFMVLLVFKHGQQWNSRQDYVYFFLTSGHNLHERFLNIYAKSATCESKKSGTCHDANWNGKVFKILITNAMLRTLHFSKTTGHLVMSQKTRSTFMESASHKSSK